MNPDPNMDVEQRLRRATAWEGPTPAVWAAALESPRRATASLVEAVRSAWGRPLVKAAAGIMLAVGAVIMYSIQPEPSRSMPYAPSMARSVEEQSVASRNEPSRKRVADDGLRGYATSLPLSSPAANAPPPPPLPASPSPDEISPERIVIRKATIELETKDPRATFAKIALLVNDATGEYIQESSLTGGTGTGDARQPLYGSLTLRIGVSRLSDVLNRLRELGTVTGEASGGEDVTSQSVDLDARLRNEERVEKELLELLASRTDAPLKEILELREKIAQVRDTIERLTAQRERLSHLASLATVLVIVREPGTPSVETHDDASAGTYFTKRVTAAWRDGVRGLSDSVAWLFNVLVAGAVWWIALGVGVIWAIRALRRSATPRG